MPDVTREPADWRSTVGGRIAVEIDALRSAVASLVDVLPFGPLQDDGFCRICARYDGHAADCEWEALALLAGEGTAQPDPTPDEQLSDAVNLRVLAAGIDRGRPLADGWPETLRGIAGRLFAYVEEVGDPRLERGTAPQVPAEEDGALSILRRLAITNEYVEWSIEMAPSDTLQWVRIDRDSRSWEYFEPLSEAEQAAYRRVVAADGAPQEGDER